MEQLGAAIANMGWESCIELRLGGTYHLTLFAKFAGYRNSIEILARFILNLQSEVRRDVIAMRLMDRRD